MKMSCEKALENKSFESKSRINIQVEPRPTKD